MLNSKHYLLVKFRISLGITVKCFAFSNITVTDVSDLLCLPSIVSVYELFIVMMLS